MFTNVPVNETMDIIINNIHNNPSLPPLKINPNILRKILITYTTEVPFPDHAYTHTHTQTHTHTYIYIYTRIIK